MANILQVTGPEVNMGNTGIRSGVGAGQIGGSRRVGNTQIPGTVQGEPASEATGDQAAVDFESNYASFVQRLQGNETLSQTLAELLFGDGAVSLRAGDAEAKAALAELYNSISADDPETLLDYMQSQTGAQVKYSGKFFDGLRSLLHGGVSDHYKEVILKFLRSYNSYTAGEHLLTQMKALADDAEVLMMRSVRGEFEEIVEQMDWQAQNGDTEVNTKVLNEKLIPYLSRYVSRTHDYGAIRKAAVMLSLYAVKYEQGSEKELVAAFRQMSRNGDFSMVFEEEPGEALVNKLAEHQNQEGKGMAEVLSQLLMKGTQGKAGAENIEKYFQALQHMLQGESVYMPIQHLLIPFRFQDQNVMTEMWVDPDADKDKRHGESGDKSLKLFVKFNIEKLGAFDLLALMKRKNVDLQIFVPDTVDETPRRIENTIRDILRRNGLNADVTMSPKVRDIGVQEVFPELKAAERSINVRI